MEYLASWLLLIESSALPWVYSLIDDVSARPCSTSILLVGKYMAWHERQSGSQTRMRWLGIFFGILDGPTLWSLGRDKIERKQSLMKIFSSPFWYWMMQSLWQSGNECRDHYGHKHISKLNAYLDGFDTIADVHWLRFCWEFPQPDK